VLTACRFQPFQDLSEEDQQTVRHFNQKLQDKFDVKFPKGSNPDLQLMQHLWEPLRVVHKPLIIHVFSEMSTFCTHLLLQVSAKEISRLAQPTCNFSGLNAYANNSPVCFAGSQV
jgi:hypothetical protein